MNRKQGRLPLSAKISQVGSLEGGAKELWCRCPIRNSSGAFCLGKARSSQFGTTSTQYCYCIGSSAYVPGWGVSSSAAHYCSFTLHLLVASDINRCPSCTSRPAQGPCVCMGYAGWTSLHKDPQKKIMGEISHFSLPVLKPGAGAPTRGAAQLLTCFQPISTDVSQ